MLPQFLGYRWEGSPKTLVLTVRAECEFCQASLPFYERLSSLGERKLLRACVLIVTPDDQKSGSAVSKFSSLDCQRVLGQSLGEIRVLGTPTVMLVDSGGRVLKSWVGLLSPSDEQSVISPAER